MEGLSMSMGIPAIYNVFQVNFEQIELKIKLIIQKIGYKYCLRYLGQLLDIRCCFQLKMLESP